MRDIATCPIPINVDNAIVQDMWKEGNDWNWDGFSHLLPTEYLKMVAPHKLIEDLNVSVLVY